jgi:signal transduction histidine kinase
VLNALKFTSAGKVTVEASTQMDSSVEIRIRDTGIGMRPEEVHEVLEGFKQGDPTARKRFRGIGLGLRLVTRLLEALAGTLDVVSTLGAGTEFILHVPPLPEETEQRGTESIANEPIAQLKAQASA